MPMEKAKKELVSIVIPVYNEEEAIGQDIDLIAETMKAGDFNYEILVVDDGSTDLTTSIVRERGEVRLTQHPTNRGTGAATKTGIMNAKGKIIVVTDGDGTYPNQDIPKLLAHMLEHEIGRAHV